LPPEEAEEKSSEPDFSKRVSYLEPDPSDHGYAMPDPKMLKSSIKYSELPTKSCYDPVYATTIPHHP